MKEPIWMHSTRNRKTCDTRVKVEGKTTQSFHSPLFAFWFNFILFELLHFLGSYTFLRGRKIFKRLPDCSFIFAIMNMNELFDVQVSLDHFPSHFSATFSWNSTLCLVRYEIIAIRVFSPSTEKWKNRIKISLRNSIYDRKKQKISDDKCRMKAHLNYCR